jgi:hypothetical protein
MNCGNVRPALIRVGAIEYRSTVHGSADTASVFIGTYPTVISGKC